MNDDYPQTAFAKAILTGLFLGITDTLICLVFAVIYRSATGFYLFEIINFPATIFGCNLILLAFGAVYFMFRKMNKLGEPAFILFFVLLTLLCLWGTQRIQISDDPVLTAQFRGLLSGYLIIIGASAAIGIPFLYHNKKFGEVVV